MVPTVQPDKVNYDRWFIQPRATWKVRWDLWIGSIIAYSVVLIPYRIGFGIELAVRKLVKWHWQAVGLIFTLCFWLLLYHVGLGAGYELLF